MQALHHALSGLSWRLRSPFQRLSAHLRLPPPHGSLSPPRHSSRGFASFARAAVPFAEISPPVIRMIWAIASALDPSIWVSPSSKRALLLFFPIWPDKKLRFVLDLTPFNDDAVIIAVGLLLHSRLLPVPCWRMPEKQPMAREAMEQCRAFA